MPADPRPASSSASRSGREPRRVGLAEGAEHQRPRSSSPCRAPPRCAPSITAMSRQTTGPVRGRAGQRQVAQRPQHAGRVAAAAAPRWSAASGRCRLPGRAADGRAAQLVVELVADQRGRPAAKPASPSRCSRAMARCTMTRRSCVRLSSASAMDGRFLPVRRNRRPRSCCRTGLPACPARRARARRTRGRARGSRRPAARRKPAQARPCRAGPSSARAGNSEGRRSALRVPPPIASFPAESRRYNFANNASCPGGTYCNAGQRNSCSRREVNGLGAARISKRGAPLAVA